MFSQFPIAETLDGKKPLTAITGIAAASAVLLQASGEGSLLTEQAVVQIAGVTLGVSGLAFFAGWQVQSVERDGDVQTDLKALTSWAWRCIGRACGVALPLCLFVLGASLVMAVSLTAALWFLIVIALATISAAILITIGRVALNVRQTWRAAVEGWKKARADR